MAAVILKCCVCKKYPDDEVYQCRKKHITCEDCAERSNELLCMCGERLCEKQKNPIERLMQTSHFNCQYKEFGCTWKFTAKEMMDHLKECKFRPSRCIAATLNVLECNWKGQQHEMEDHILESHKELGTPFTYYQTSSMTFIGSKSIGSLKLVDAFSKSFVFYIFSDAAKKTVIFMMIYLGRREEADQYFVELEIRPRKVIGDYRRIKFVERCFSDSEDLEALEREERCISMSHAQVRNHLVDGSLHFRFIVKKLKDDTATEEVETVAAVVGKPQKQKPRPPPLVFAKKGPQQTSAVAAKSAPKTAPVRMLQTVPFAAVPAPTSTTEASTVLRTRQPPVGDHGDAVQRFPEYSSINRASVAGSGSPLSQMEECPLLTPSITKTGDLPPSSWKLTHTSLTNTTEYRQITCEEIRTVNRPPPGECTNTATVCKVYTQPYKVQDNRFYLQKYPDSCLSKPILRR